MFVLACSILKLLKGVVRQLQINLPWKGLAQLLECTHNHETQSLPYVRRRVARGVGHILLFVFRALPLQHKSVTECKLLE